MPYLKTLGLIFVAIPKTGTTSVTRALSNIAVHGKEMQLVKEPITAGFRKKHGFNMLRDRKPGRAKHLSAEQIRLILGQDEFLRCFKFSIVRNPWARMVSGYFYTHIMNEPSEIDKQRRGTTRTFHDLEFDEWIDRRWNKWKQGKMNNSQLKKLTDESGNLLVDHVGRLENAQESLDLVMKKTFTSKLLMPHVNGTKKNHYTKYYNEFTKRKVYEMCQQDIEYFKYKFT